MASQALYRKYRSADFTQVIGQEPVVRTLVSAINNGRLSHAYLFTGPRGVGKTSVARLLARALNCTGETKPCNQCELCQAAINSSLDIVEIDAASNRSIDAVRDLREKVGIAPAQGKYKVYIIDEVHMLTAEAFNALLKTLEEPPAHAVFVLATTEAHKLPETIISRTQRFTFKPITEVDIVAHLGVIAAKEGIKVEPEALHLIATAARGGFRDAIGMLDQAAASGDTAVTATAVRSLLGLSDIEGIGAMSRAIATNDAAGAIETLATLLDQGAQPGQLTSQLVGLWREALLSAVGKAGPNPLANDLASQLSPGRIAMIIEVLLEAAGSRWPHESLEVAVVRLAAGPIAETKVESRAAETTPKAATLPAAETIKAPKAAETKPTEAVAPARAELWPKVLANLKTQNNSLCALLQMYPVDFADGGIVIKARFNFHRDLFLKPANRRIIEEVVQRVYGQPLSISAVTDEKAGAKRSSAAKPDPSHELISSALEILGGEVVE